MAHDRHSFVAFYPSDWKGGTAHMPRLVRAVYFDICLYTWDKGKPVPASALMMMLSDLENGPKIVEALVDEGRLILNPDGSIHSPRALIEAEKATRMWEGKSAGGRAARGKAGKDSSKSVPSKLEQSSQDSSIEPEPTCEPEPSKEVEEGKTALLGPADVAEAWNEMARHSGLAQINKITDERSGRLKARIEEYGAQAIIDGIKLIPEVPFLMGKGDRGWKAHFDWLLQPKSCAKLLEGGYEQGSGKPSGWTE